MSRFHSYLNSAERVLRHYKGEVPLSVYLKQFFSENRQMGGRDRKMISQLCYQTFRLGYYKNDRPAFERIVEAAAFFPEENAAFLSAVAPQLLSETQQRHFENIPPAEIFPFHDLLSSGVDAASFALSFRQQPDLFLRIRPGQVRKVKALLDKEDVPWQELHEGCLRLPNTTNIAQAIELNRMAVVQDCSSQRTGELIGEVLNEFVPEPLNVWDCCAASGGKSIMLFDLFQHIWLTVSDIRESILQNLKSRFQEAGIKDYTSFQANLTTPQSAVPNAPFDLILADVPCTGSGTWARTPENLVFFNQEILADFSNRQYAIANEAMRWLKPQGWFVYITCSVFAAENEEVAIKLAEENQLKTIISTIIPGWQHAADSMYIAIMQK